MNDAYDTIEELMNETTRTKVSDDEKASLGISGTGVSDEAAEAYGIPSGVFVSQVTEGGAAEQAGITANSIITAFDGKSVSDISELKSRLEYYKAGEEVEVTLQVPDGNGYTEKNVTVTLGKADSSTSGSSLQSGRIRTRDRIRIITAVPMTIPETISVSQTARKAFEQKKYLKNFHTANLQIQRLPLTFYNDPLQYGFSNAIL